MVHILADNVTATAAQTPINTWRHEGAEGTFGVSMTSGTVVLQGRMCPTDSWITIDTFTATGGKIVALFPQMRVDITTGVAVTARLSEPS